MADIIYQIPGYEKGRVQHVRASDREGVSLIVAQMVADLRRKWSTSCGLPLREAVPLLGNRTAQCCVRIAPPSWRGATPTLNM